MQQPDITIIRTVNLEGEPESFEFEASDPIDGSQFENAGLELISSVVNIEFPRQDKHTIDLDDCADRIYERLGKHFDRINRGGGKFPQGKLDEFNGTRYSNVSELLGSDGNNWTHMLKQALRSQALRKATARETNALSGVEYGISESTSGLLSFLGLVHDLGELIHGDLINDEKHDDYDERVNQSGRDITIKILGSGSDKPLVSDEIINLAFDVELGSSADPSGYEAFGISEQEFNEMCNLWRYGVEYLEYTETALVAAQNIVKVQNDDNLTDVQKAELIEILREYAVGSAGRNLPEIIMWSVGNNGSDSRETITEFLLGKPERTEMLDNLVAYVESQPGDSDPVVELWQTYKQSHILMALMTQTPTHPALENTYRN